MHTTPTAFFRRPRRLLILFLALTIALTERLALPQDTSTAADGALLVMTYNLRFASATGPNAWPDRRPLVRDCIRSVSPDIIGTQEGLYAQLKEIAADLPEYEWIGLGREGASRSEFMAVFYRKPRFEPLAFGHFWLSDTPNVIGSSTWGNSNRRMVTWVRFLDRRTKREFFLFNTHFDHEIQPAREKSAALLRERVQALNTSLPVILTGDFNAGEQNKAHEILAAEAMARALRHPAGARPLEEEARGLRSACILVCDLTRPVPNGLLLPPLVRGLLASGIDASPVTVLVATGLHRPTLGAELEELVGDRRVLGAVRVENHDDPGTTPPTWTWGAPRAARR